MADKLSEVKSKALRAKAEDTKKFLKERKADAATAVAPAALLPEKTYVEKASKRVASDLHTLLQYLNQKKKVPHLIKIPCS